MPKTPAQHPVTLPARASMSERRSFMLRTTLVAGATGLCLSGMLLSATAHAATAEAPKTMNPFFQISPLPFQYPQFDKITDADFAPAFERGMADNSREIEAIANSKDKPTFENTIEAMERSGELLYVANLPLSPTGKWQLVVSDASKEWKLRAELNLPVATEIKLGY